MIQTSVYPTQISLDQLAEVTLRFAYNGREFCTEIYFEIVTPEGFFLMGGNPKGTIPLLEQGEYYDHPLRVLAEQSGSFDFIITRLTYRDEVGRVQRLPDYPVSIYVFKPLAPVLDLSMIPVTLPADQWCGLPVTVRNIGKGMANQVSLHLACQSLQANETGIVIQQLRPGEEHQLTFAVCLNKAGSRVPVDITATCRDDTGAGHSFKWRHYLVVEEKPATQTIHNQMNFHDKVTGPIHTGEGNINIGSKQENDE